MENGDVLVSDLSPSVWGVVVFQSLNKPSVCSSFHKLKQTAENCQLLDVMAVVAIEMVTSAQRSDVIWDAEAII